jgi:hypothetical protein
MKTISFLDRFLLSLLPWHRNHLVDQLAGEVARRCRADLWQRMGWRVNTMSVSEIRGYARAHAAGWLRSEVDQALARHELGPGLCPQVAASAMDRLITMVIHDVLSDQPPSDVNTMAA